MGFAGEAEAITCAGELTVAPLEGMETDSGNDSSAGGGGSSAGGAGNGLVVGSQVTAMGGGVGEGTGAGVGFGVGAGNGEGVGCPVLAIVELVPQPASMRASSTMSPK